MKRLLLFFISVFVYLNTHGQNTYIGSIVPMGSYYFLETASNHYMLTLNSLPIRLSSGLIVENIEYFTDDIVAITGTAKLRYPNSIEDYELEIETIKKWSPNQDIQRFLGEYSLKGMCKVLAPWQDEIPLEKYVVIKTGIESDLLIQYLGFAQSDFKAFILNDSLFIPNQWGNIVWEYPESFRGGGEIKNDTLFMRFRNGGEFGVLECECKGRKIGSTNILSPSGLNKNKVYLDATNQVIVIDETLQNQSLTFELIDLQGNTIWKKTNVGESINIAYLPSGIYLCRILQNGQMIYSDKILKK